VEKGDELHGVDLTVYLSVCLSVCLSISVYICVCLHVYRGWNELLGILVGHVYFFLMFKYPQDFGGTQFISTPQIL